MKHRTCVLVLVAALLAGFPRPAEAAVEARRIIVLTVDATSLSSWLRAPELSGILTAGSSALLAARAGGDARDFETARRAAYATLAAGRRTTSPEDGRVFRAALAEGHVPLFVSRSLQSFVDGDAAPELGALPRPSVAVVAARDVGGCADEGCAAAAARRAIAPGDALLVLSPIPPDRRVHDGVWLSVAVVLVTGSPPGTLRTPTTRRAGVVALIDVAPTILTLAGLEAPASMDGRAFERANDGPAIARLRSIEADFVRAARARRPATRAWMAAAMLVLAGAAISTLRRGSRRPAIVVEVALAGLPAVPAALLAIPLLPPLSNVLTVVVALAFAAVLGVAARTVLRPVDAIAATAALSAAIVLGDVLSGGWLAARSPASYLIAGGVRFYGIGNELMGVVVAGGIATCAILFRRTTRGNARIFVPLVAAFATGVMAAPGVGAKFGAVLAAVPAFMVMFVGLAGRRVTLRTGAAIAAVTVAVAGAIYAVDRFAAPATRSHIGRASGGGIGSIVARKIDASLGIAAFSIWMQTLIVCALLVLLVWRIRGAELRTPLARPALGASLRASAVAIVLAPVTNDAGLIASAVLAVTATALLLASVGRERAANGTRPV